MAPPITVDIMAFLLCRKNIARGKPQQEDRYRRRAALALPMPLSSRYGLQQWLADGLCERLSLI
jgi:hypothetical protein